MEKLSPNRTQLFLRNKYSFYYGWHCTQLSCLSTKIFPKSNSSEAKTYMAFSKYKNLCHNFDRPILGHHNFILGLSNLQPGVEKIFFEEMHQFYTFYHQIISPWGIMKFNFLSPYPTDSSHISREEDVNRKRQHKAAST